MHHGELRSDRGSWFVIEFFLQLSIFNISDTFKTGDWSSYIFLKLVYHQPQLCPATVRLEHREDLSGIDSHPVSVSSEHVERKQQGLLTKPTQNPKPNKNEDHEKERWDPFWKGCKNSEKILWKIEFLNAETHTPVLLVNRLWSLCLREVRIWVDTVLTLTYLKTETARSVRGSKLQEPCAEDAVAEPYLVQKILEIW